MVNYPAERCKDDGKVKPWVLQPGVLNWVTELNSWWETGSFFAGAACKLLAAAGDEPFFHAEGSRKPHLPFSAPLIMAAPGMAAAECDALVDFVDIYPALDECCGLPQRDDLKGISVAPLLRPPEQPWTTAGFSLFPRPSAYRGETDVMGYSMRTDRFRYSKRRDFRNGNVIERELYNHGVSGADRSRQLRAGWRAASPGQITQTTADTSS